MSETLERAFIELNVGVNTYLNKFVLEVTVLCCGCTMLMPLDKGLREKINFLNELYILYCCLTSLVTMIARLSRGVKYLVPQFLHSVQFGVRGPKTSVAYFD